MIVDVKKGEKMEYIIHNIIPVLYLGLELIGAAIIVIGSLKALVLLIKNGFDFRNEDLIVELASSLSLALEFILAAEILQTLVVSDLQQLLLLGVLLILRIIITFVLHWELNYIEENKRRTQKEEELHLMKTKRED